MANKTISDAGGNWNANGAWVEGSPPTTADDVIATSSSGQVTVNTTTCVCKSLNLANYTNTITFTAGQKLTVSGSVNFTMGVGGAIAGTGNLTVNGAGTITSNALTFTGSLTLSLNGTITLGDNWTVTGLVTNTLPTLTLTGNQLTCNGGLTTTSAMTGTAKIVLGGGIWSGGGALNNNLDINCTTATISAMVNYRTGTLTYVTGTITTTGSILSISANCTLNTNGLTWGTVTFGAGAVTITLSSELQCTILSITATNTAFAGAFNITCETFRVIPASSGMSFTLLSGQLLTVTTNLYLNGRDELTCLIKSSSATNATTIVYQGTIANCKVFRFAFTDVTFVSSIINLNNWYGDTLTRTQNIINRTPADLKTTGSWGAGALTLESGANARGGSGNCVKLNPSSTVDKLIWTFLIPVTASTYCVLNLYYKITAGYNGTMRVTVYDTDNITKLVTESNIQFIDDGDYHLEEIPISTPTNTGFCRVVLEILDGASSGDIYIDDISLT